MFKSFATILYLVTLGLFLAPISYADSYPTLLGVPPWLASSGDYPQPLILLTPTSLKSFDTALPELARQSHLAFVCENQPFHLELTDKQADALGKQFGSTGLPLAKAVELLAEAYDYEAVRTSPHVYLLNKRYTEADDLPDIPYEEANLSLQNILRDVQTYVPSVSSEVYLRNLYQSSSEAERARMVEGIPVASLSVNQQQMLWQVGCGVPFNYLHDLKWISRRIAACQSPKSFISVASEGTYQYEIYNGPYGIAGGMRETALSGFLYTCAGGGTGYQVNYFQRGPGNSYVLSRPQVPDPTVPRQTISVIRPSVLRLSLTQIAARYSQRFASSTPEHPAVSADTPIASKSVCVSGDENAAPDELVTSVAEVYGLRVRRENGVATFAMPLLRTINDPREVVGEIRRLLPLPFLEKVNTNAPGQQDNSKQGLRAQGLSLAAIRRVRESVEPEIKKRADHRLRLADTNDETKQMLALACLAAFALDHRRDSLLVPGYLSNFNEAILQLKLDERVSKNTYRYMIWDGPEKKGGGGALVLVPPEGVILPE